MNASNSSSLKAATSSDDLAHQLEALRADVSKLMTTVSDDVSARPAARSAAPGTTRRWPQPMPC